jgi:hypothetical protein
MGMSQDEKSRLGLFQQMVENFVNETEKRLKKIEKQQKDRDAKGCPESEDDSLVSQIEFLFNSSLVVESVGDVPNKFRYKPLRELLRIHLKLLDQLVQVQYAIDNYNKNEG